MLSSDIAIINHPNLAISSFQGFPTFQGLRAVENVGKSEGHVPQAVATPCPPVADKTEKVSAIHAAEAVDAEELLKELDACGVRSRWF